MQDEPVQRGEDQAGRCRARLVRQHPGQFAFGRLEVELIPRLADIRAAGEVPRVRSDFVNGIEQLPVEVALARTAGGRGRAHR
ncbi:hypothetical protein [Streptomyces olivaceiscleroticus]|uniref:hypothetical protein n=1 Tax=Streptomyces olivaceiscleroticus TaxID=68245 RepID=UPI0031F90412